MRLAETVVCLKLRSTGCLKKRWEAPPFRQSAPGGRLSAPQPGQSILRRAVIPQKPSRLYSRGGVFSCSTGVAGRIGSYLFDAAVPSLVECTHQKAVFYKAGCLQKSAQYLQGTLIYVSFLLCI